jgi:GH25 family lysozyme M1 (1,4-beta-N-acetylmuramidase)
MVYFGLDISHHQDLRLDLAQCKREGISFVILKSTEGAGYIDPAFKANLAEAKSAGLPVAAYHYVRSDASAAVQVANVRQAVPLDVPVIPDVEANSGAIALTREVVARLEAAGYRVPLLYLPRWYWQQIGSPSLAGLPPLWSSRYPDNVVGSLASEFAKVPASYWNGYGGLEVGLLQFTSSASVAGFQPLDANAFRGSAEELAALFGGEGDDMFETADRNAQADDGWRTWAIAQGLTEIPKRGDIPQRLWGEPVHVVRAIVEIKAGLAALAKAVADGDLDPEEVMRRMETASREGAAEGAERGVTETVLPKLETALEEVLGADNADQARRVVEMMGDLLRPAPKA